MSQYLYDRTALLAHANGQALRLVEANPLMKELKERMGLEIDPDGHFEAWRVDGALQQFGEGTRSRPEALTNDELQRYHQEAQAIIAQSRQRIAAARNTTMAERNGIQS